MIYSLLQVTQVDHAGIASINISEGLQIQPKDIDYWKGQK